MTIDDDRRFRKLANDSDPDLAEMLELIWDRLDRVEEMISSLTVAPVPSSVHKSEPTLRPTAKPLPVASKKPTADDSSPSEGAGRPCVIIREAPSTESHTPQICKIVVREEEPQHVLVRCVIDYGTGSVAGPPGA